jgi:hypothetical protein
LTTNNGVHVAILMNKIGVNVRCDAQIQILIVVDGTQEVNTMRSNIMNILPIVISRTLQSMN